MYSRSPKTHFLIFLRDLLLRSPLEQHFRARYYFQFSPVQLGFICQKLNETKNLSGCIIQIGCDPQETVTYLTEYLKEIEDKRAFLAIDSFGGKHQNREFLSEAISRQGLSNATVISADISDYDLSEKGLVSFCLVDVRQYNQAKSGIQKAFSHLESGGFILVSNCTKDSGSESYQAYSEFCKDLGSRQEIIHNQFGVVTKAQNNTSQVSLE